MKNIVVDFLIGIKIDRIWFYLTKYIPFYFKLRRYELQSSQKINFVPQGAYSLELLGDLKKFKIHNTSHLKSDTVIECTGGVEIGKYFHTGRGLTIFSANHNWKEASKIPYDETIVCKKVIIEDFVWIGANALLLPGTKIREGAIIAGGSVVNKEVGRCEIWGGNPARMIGKRDVTIFDKLKKNKAFH